jgi:anti-anti-sigma factor
VIAGPIFTAELVHDGGPPRLALAGELDLATVPVLEKAIPALGSGDALVIDLRELEFIDSSGVHVLMRLDDAARRDGWTLTLVRAGRDVQRVLDLCHVGDRVRIVDSP